MTTAEQAVLSHYASFHNASWHLILSQTQVKKDTGCLSKTAERMTVKLVMSPEHNIIPFWMSYNKRQRLQ